MHHRHAGRHAHSRLIFFRLVGHDHNFLNAFAFELLDDHRDIERAIHLLTTSHRDRIIEQNFVGDRNVRRYCRANRQQARVIVGTIANVGEHMLLIGKRRLANPRHALAPHLREHLRVAPHPGDHVVATNARHATRTLGHTRGGVVRATGAEPGLALDSDAGTGQLTLTRLDEIQPGLNASPNIIGQRELEQPCAQGFGHNRR